ncbi:hypothetical protein NT01EI_2106 [Edwardsiella ictaluri 93-146]|uniref:Uncharacterized protein n=1 Tax=Edwardsiella ictaluri (strain 93-146) TaxID=634503 RepID=C5BE41_EDWI9|nr:hypothetical protein NT01EI_2106 [Edwardsiella ictaluri 93-146]STP80998.1 Uncharacterised protein [Edwardsiella ictaluri]
MAYPPYATRRAAANFTIVAVGVAGKKHHILQGLSHAHGSDII